MSNLPLPVLASEVPGNFITSSLWMNNVYNGLTYAYNPPTFYGYQSVAQSVPNNSWAALTIDSEVIDSYGAHSTTSNTSRFVVPQAGYYWVSGTVTWATNTSGNRAAALYKNGATVSGAYFSAAASSYNSSATATAIIQASANDFIEMYVSQGSGTSLSTVANYSYLTVLWIHA